LEKVCVAVGAIESGFMSLDEGFGEICQETNRIIWRLEFMEKLDQLSWWTT
jgi:hypothetical protein